MQTRISLKPPVVTFDSLPVDPGDKDSIAFGVERRVAALFDPSPLRIGMVDQRVLAFAGHIDESQYRGAKKAFVEIVPSSKLHDLERDLLPHDDGWNLKYEFESARDNHDNDNLTFAVRLSRGGPYVGMATLRRSFDVDVDDLPTGHSLTYNYEGDHLFLIPSVRGRGLSVYLRYAIEEIVSIDIGCMKALRNQPSADPELVPSSLRVYMYSEAHSEEGLHFLDQIAGILDYVIDTHFDDPDYDGPKPTASYDYGI